MKKSYELWRVVEGKTEAWTFIPSDHPQHTAMTLGASLTWTCEAASYEEALAERKKRFGF